MSSKSEFEIKRALPSRPPPLAWVRVCQTGGLSPRISFSSQRGSARGISTVCWNVGRFWNSIGGIVTALAATERLRS